MGRRGGHGRRADRALRPTAHPVPPAASRPRAEERYRAAETSGVGGPYRAAGSFHPAGSFRAAGPCRADDGSGPRWSDERAVRSREVAAPLVTFLLFSVVTIVATGVLAVTGGFPAVPAHTYSAVFTDVGDLETGDEILVSGVPVGEVEAIRTGDRAVAEVRFTVARDRPLLSGTQAEIRYRGLVGRRYIALVEGPGGGARLKPGAVIPPERTRPASGLRALLGGFPPSFAALGRAALPPAAEVVALPLGEGFRSDSLVAELLAVGEPRGGATARPSSGGPR